MKMMNGKTSALLVTMFVTVRVQASSLEDDIDACLWHQGAESMARCESVLQGYSSNELMMLHVDGCSAWLVVHGRKAQLHAARGEYAQALRHGELALQDAGRAASPERVMWIVYLCAVAAERCGATKEDSARYWRRAEGFAEHNDQMAGMLAQHQAEQALAYHATNEALYAVANAYARDPFLNYTLAITYAYLLQDAGRYGEAFDMWLTIARDFAHEQHGQIVREAYSILDDLVPYATQQQVERYTLMRALMPSRFPASARYAEPVGRLMALRRSEAAVNELQLRELESAGVRGNFSMITGFIASLHYALYCVDDKYGYGTAVLMNHRTRAEWLAGRILCEQGSHAEGIERWLRQLEERVRFCMDIGGAMLMVTGVYAHAGMLSPVQSNRFAAFVAGHARQVERMRAQRVTEFATFAARNRMRYSARMTSVLRQMRVALTNWPASSVESTLDGSW